MMVSGHANRQRPGSASAYGTPLQKNEIKHIRHYGEENSLVLCKSKRFKHGTRISRMLIQHH